MKVFQLSDYEWWYAETLEAAFAAAFEETGEDRESYEKDFTPHELTPEEMDAPGTVNMADEVPPEMVSFRYALDIVTADGSKAGLLCGSES